jgi:hypothetical protein
MRMLILIFLVVIAVGAATGAAASDGPVTVSTGPPTMASDVTCAPWGEKGISCFYPAHDK